MCVCVCAHASLPPIVTCISGPIALCLITGLADMAAAEGAHHSTTQKLTALYGSGPLRREKPEQQCIKDSLKEFIWERFDVATSKLRSASPQR